MQKTFTSLIIAAALGTTAVAHAASARSNEAATKRHLASLLAGSEPRVAELTMFFTGMPKGGDLHHHYSGSLYAERYLEWVDREGYCINKISYRIETNKDVVQTERALAPGARMCLSAREVVADDGLYRELLQRWSSKDFANHGAIQPPPDRQFFETFGYFGPVSSSYPDEGLRELKQRALAENVSYIETMFKLAPFAVNGEFDQAVVRAGADDAALTAALQQMSDTLEQDAAFKQSVADYVTKVGAAAAHIDDEQFTMRYQAYVLRLLAPSQVFSSMLAGFKAVSQSPLIVGVNIVGAENNAVSMRDYSLHMKMFRFLKTTYPNVKLALHAGELALGMVPPEGLKFHIGEALDIAGANRIGHGMDLAHEANAARILKTMREQDVAVEVNLTSNDFILGIKGQAHPVLLYRKYHVPFVISTDDAGVSRNNLTNEYVLFASRYKPDYAEIKKLSYNGVRYAFLPDADKKRLTRQLDARFARFEAEIATMRSTVAPTRR